MQHRLRDWLDFWRSLLQRFVDDRGTSSAAALTYTTLFAVVPMMMCSVIVSVQLSRL